VQLRLKEKPFVEDVHNYGASLVQRLSDLLVAGASARADARRKGFYDVTDGERVYFIHISPVSGKVFLLATWLEESVPAAAAVPAVAHPCLEACAGLF